MSAKASFLKSPPLRDLKLFIIDNSEDCYFNDGNAEGCYFNVDNFEDYYFNVDQGAEALRCFCYHIAGDQGQATPMLGLGQKSASKHPKGPR